MANQLPLALQQRLRYSHQNFVLHKGVRTLFEECLVLPADSFAFRYIVGKPRCGKTHFAIALAERLLEDGKSFPILFSGQDFERELRAGQLLELSNGSGISRTTFIVDDGDHCLKNITPGNSGPFVTFVELLRKQCANLVILSSTSCDLLPCDDHVKSRVRAGITNALGAPAEDELGRILESLAHQRGVVLTERSRKFLLRRVRREIPAIEIHLDRLIHLAQVLGRSITFSALPESLTLDQ